VQKSAEAGLWFKVMDIAEKPELNPIAKPESARRPRLYLMSLLNGQIRGSRGAFGPNRTEDPNENPRAGFGDADAVPRPCYCTIQFRGLVGMGSFQSMLAGGAWPRAID
jgi:hypothetical protein